ncbi:hypothetical protein Trco_006030 [Trichoderma cornu-damae]|uniref:Twinfilin-1 n=1 Tax=Trichoderma cornu-damae TaxID=654480 RepID=A0A9P8TWC2_9HYPO|nr:hypothetical protein Trco_006030 [Trichoderma cornu-damae]
MKGIFLLALVGVTRIGGQTTHSTGAFSYQGCSSIDPSCFGDLIVFSDGRLIPESCQLACQGHQFAALLPDSCRCGDDANGIHLIDDAKCDYPCMGDSSLGMCGSICPEKTSAIANIYTRVTPSQGPAYGDPTSVESSAAAVETSCSPTDASSVGEPPQSSRRITPEGPAPEVPTSFGNPAATETPAPGSPSTQAPQEPPCETQSNTGLSTPSHGPQDPHDPQGPLTPPGSAPEPKTVNQPLPSTTPSANAPKYSKLEPASEELQKAFSSLLATPSDFALLVTIRSESLVPVETIAGRSSDFGQNLAVLEPFVKPDAALYAILRRYDDTPRFVAVTYVPDAANIRQKMLFASTRLTLVRELGTEHFRETPFMTMAHELTDKGFKAHDAHNALEAPLTEEERTLGEVKRAEQEAGSGTAVREIHLSQSLNMPVDEDAIAAMKEVAEGRKAVATLKIDAAAERVKLVPESPNPGSIGELVKSISTVEPRFTFYRFTHTHDGAEQAPVLFFYTCPATPGNRAIRNRMLYPLMKRAVLAIAEQEAGITLAKKFEVEDPGEITEQEVLNDLHPRPVASSGFSRPKRPGK